MKDNIDFIPGGLKTSNCCSFLGFTGMLLPLVFTSGPGEIENQKTVRPNILIIIADDLGWNDVGYHGSEILTPNLDKMARQGIEFNRFYACSVSSPTRASLLTGRFPSKFGILTPLSDDAGLPTGTETIASLLRKNGYDTGISGKWHLGANEDARPLRYGFNTSYGYFRGQIDPYTHLYKNGDRTWHRNDVLIDEEGHATDLITDEAVKFIKKPRKNNTPFFLYVAYSVPHSPLEEPNEWTSRYSGSIPNESRRNFAASVSHMDNSIGKLLDALKDESLGNNTIVIFLSDNGGQQRWVSKTEYAGRFKPHDVLGNNLPLRDWKGSLYDGALRVPAIMIWPGRLKPAKIEDPISVVDIFPSLASITVTGVPEGLKLDGINFMPVISGAGKPGERIIYWKSPNNIALLKGNWKIIHSGTKPEDGKDELYNIHLDPYERNDLSGDNIQKVNELKEEILNQIASDLSVQKK